jgi:hypothetical protein
MWPVVAVAGSREGVLRGVLGHRRHEADPVGNAAQLTVDERQQVAVDVVGDLFAGVALDPVDRGAIARPRRRRLR